MTTLNSFLVSLKSLSSIQSTNPEFVHPLTLNLTRIPNLSEFQKNIQKYSNEELDKEICNNVYIRKLEWPFYENLILNYLILIRDFDPWSIINSIDLMINYFELSINLINLKTDKIENKDNFIKSSNNLISESIKLIIPLTLLVDIENMKINNRFNYYPRLTHISTLLLKLLNNLRSSTPDINNFQNRDKINLIFQVSNSLCSIYNKIGSSILCLNVYSNINILKINNKLIFKSNLIKYKFLLGKFYFHQLSFINSFKNLESSFQLLPKNLTNLTNFEIILKYLIPVSLIVGKVPNLRNISKYINNSKTVKMYEVIIENYKIGNIFKVFEEISKNEEFFKKIGIFNAIVENLKIPILRNYLKRVYIISNKKLNWKIIKQSLSLICLQLFELNEIYQIKINTGLNNGEVINDDFVQSVLASLNMNGYIKFKNVNSCNVVFSKNDPFPDMHEVIKSRYPTPPKEMWLE